MPGLFVRLLPLWAFFFLTVANVVVFNLPRELFTEPLVTYSLPLLAGVVAGMLFGHTCSVHILGKPRAGAQPAPWGMLVLLYGTMPMLMISILTPMMQEPAPVPDMLGLFLPMVPFVVAFVCVGVAFNRYLHNLYSKAYWAARKRIALEALNAVVADLPYPPQRHMVILQQAEKLDVDGIERLTKALELVKYRAPAALNI